MAWLRPSVMVTVMVTVVVVVTALVGAVPVALLAVATAWLLSNRSDIEPRVRPAVLQLAAPTLPDERNAFFALTGLSAEAGRDPAAVGRALWQVNLARAAMPQRERLETKGYEELNRQDDAATGKRLPTVSGAPLYCKDAAAGCVAEWLADPVALAAQRAQMAVLGERCEALMAPGMGFEERLTTPFHYAVNIAPHLSGAVQCSRWWRSGAVLAWQQGRPQQSLALLQRATQLDAALLAGSQSLVGNMVAVTFTRETQATLAALAMREPALAPQLALLLAPMPDSVMINGMRRAVATEAAMNRAVMAELGECLDPTAHTTALKFGWVESRLQAINHWQCRHRVGFHPQRMQLLFEDFWVGTADALDKGLPAAITHLQTQGKLAQQRGWQWRNTIGYILFDLAAPAYASYFRQAADLLLHTEAAALALAAAAQRVPAAERAAWAQRQPLSADLRERLQWDASGQGFTVRTWYQDGQNTPVEPRKAIRFAWPTPPQG